MTDPFDLDEEILDGIDEEREHPAFHHLATLKNGSKTYLVLGAAQETADENMRQIRLLLVRRDELDEDTREYIVCDDEQEIEEIVGLLVAQAIKNISRRAAQEEEDESACLMAHGPGEFCYCDMPEYLQ